MKTTKKIQKNDIVLADYIAKLCVLAAAFILLLFIGKKVLSDDMAEVLGWWFMLLASGIAFLPLTMIVLGRFKDSGWIFSKVIGIAVSS